MADKGGVSTNRARPAQQRLKTLAQAALNADVTVGQVDALLSSLTETLTDLNQSTDGLDATLERFNATITRIDELAPRLIGVVERLEAIVGPRGTHRRCRRSGGVTDRRDRERGTRRRQRGAQPTGL